MNVPTWICDTCGELIVHPDHGWLEWIQDQDGRCHGLKLVHIDQFSPRTPPNHCGYRNFNPAKVGFFLSNCVKVDGQPVPDGFMNILEFFTQDFPQWEILEFIKRLYIPGYEHTRKHFNDAIGEGVFEPNSTEGYYSQAEIQRVLKWIESQAQD